MSEYFYNIGLEMGGLMEDPEFHVERIKSVRASSFEEARNSWAGLTNHELDLDNGGRTVWGWRVVCLGSDDPIVDIYGSYSDRERVTMVTDNSRTINHVLAGAEAYVLVSGEGEASAREKLKALSSELSDKEVDYLIMRIREIVKSS